MVHTTVTRPDGRVQERTRQVASPNALRSEELQGTYRYVFVPDSLIRVFAHDPLAVGVYVAVARFVMAAKNAVPLAARDLAAWMGSDRDADRAAIMRRIVKLEKRGWLMITRTTSTKHHLLPTWGRDHDGAISPWRLDQANSGRPNHVRGRRVPLDLLDDYIGRLDPQPGHTPALISRYFTQSLLDVTDIGVYTIGLCAEITPTPRLRHLGLHTVIGVTTLVEGRSLLELAASSQLTTITSDSIVAVQLSIHGQARLGATSTRATLNQVTKQERLCGSHARSVGRSDDVPRVHARLSQQDNQHATSDVPQPLITWDVGIDHEQINHDSSSDSTLENGGKIATAYRQFDAVVDIPSSCLALTCKAQRSIENQQAYPIAELATAVVAGHYALNPHRPISAGEWYELLTLQATYGVDQLLIWQARASRVTCERPYGVAPPYYQACAARAVADAYRPRALKQTLDPLVHNAAPMVEPLTPLDPACAALLAVMGVRERQKLSAVPYALIAAWQVALAHPGLAAQFTSPIGFAVVQMQRGNHPPSTTELDHWVGRARHKDDRYESWRCIEPLVVMGDIRSNEQQLEARVRAMAPPDADLADLCVLADAIEAGVTDAEALALLQAQRGAHGQISGGQKTHG